MTEVAAPPFETTRSRAHRRPAPERRARDSKGLRVCRHLSAHSFPTRFALQGVSFAAAECSRGVTAPARFRVESRARDERVFQPRRDPFFAATRCQARGCTKARSAGARRLVATLTSLRRRGCLAWPRAQTCRETPATSNRQSKSQRDSGRSRVL